MGGRVLVGILGLFGLVAVMEQSVVLWIGYIAFGLGAIWLVLLLLDGIGVVKLFDDPR